MGGKTKKLDLEHFEKSVNNAAGRVRGLWLGYIALVAYLIITVGSVTHRDLFLENPVTLPVLNVKLSLIGFFAVAPVFFLINHFYLLLHLVGLRRRIAEYDDAIKAEKLGGKEDIRRRELDSFVVVQAFGGTHEERSGKTAWFLKAIIWITVIIAPIVVLQQMQIVFLAYHHEGITWVHRIATLIDLGFLWLFWPAIHHGYKTLKWFEPVGSYSARLVGLGSGLLVVFSLLIATFPGEQIDKSGIGGNAAQGRFVWQTPEDLVLWPVKNHLPRNLDLRNEFLIDRDLLEKIRKRKPDSEKPYQGERTLVLSSNLKARNLTGANFSGADLRIVDLTAAKLQGAKLIQTSLQGARLNRANLQGAFLTSARLQDAMLWAANLKSASLDNAKLQGAWLFGAKLQGAWLRFARLEGATLNHASFQGARLDFANLQGASLRSASLQSAALDGAELQGASLTFANLQGAILDEAELQGASLDFASLQGVSFDEANLNGSSLRNAYLWRAQYFGQKLETYLSNPILTPITDYNELVKNALVGVFDKYARLNIRYRLAVLKPGTRISPQELKQVEFWAGREKISLSKTNYQMQLAINLRELACSPESYPYIAQGITRQPKVGFSRLESTGPNALSLARHLLNATPATCPGAVGIDAEARQSLQWIVNKLESEANR